jgi:hypothetical protein
MTLDEEAVLNALTYGTGMLCVPCFAASLGITRSEVRKAIRGLILANKIRSGLGHCSMCRQTWPCAWLRPSLGTGFSAN